MSIFNSLQTYAAKWNQVDSRNFTAEEINAVESASVVASQYGSSVCFHMVGGGVKFIPMSNNSTKGIGETVDMKTAKLVTLSREGDGDIVRVEC